MTVEMEPTPPVEAALEELEWRYKRDSKGRIRQWCAFADGDYYVSVSGLEGGMLKNARNKQSPTKTMSPADVAMSKVSSQYASKEKDGYFKTVEEARDYVPTKPMLLHRYDKNYMKVNYPALMGPKLDGVCAVLRHGAATSHFYSREDNIFEKLQFMADAIRAELEDKRGLVKYVHSHGELYAHGHPVSEIVEAIKGDNAEVLGKLKFYIFDYIPEVEYERLTYVERLKLGRDVYKWDKPGALWEPIRTLVVHSAAEVKEGTQNFILQGFEGSVVNNIKGLYSWDTRSYDKLKVKQLFSEEFVIAGFTHEFKGTTKMIVFTCVSKVGTMFNVRPAWSDAKRSKAYKAGETYVGKKLTVEYRSLTKYNIPFHPVAKTVRDYE